MNISPVATRTIRDPRKAEDQSQSVAGCEKSCSTVPIGIYIIDTPK